MPKRGLLVMLRYSEASHVACARHGRSFAALRMTSERHPVGHWALVICWSLVLGHWSFAFSPRPHDLRRPLHRLDQHLVLDLALFEVEPRAELLVGGEAADQVGQGAAGG